MYLSLLSEAHKLADALVQKLISAIPDNVVANPSLPAQIPGGQLKMA
jgi:hypothetical protein